MRATARAGAFWCAVFALAASLAGCRIVHRSRPRTRTNEADILRRSVAVRLPARRRASFTPTLYKLDATVADDLKSFRGSEHIVYTNNSDEPVADVVLRLFPNADFFGTDAQPNLALESVRCDGRAARPAGVGEVVRVPLLRKLRPGREARLELQFAGRVPVLPARARGMVGQFVQDLLLMTSPRYKGHYGIYALGDGTLNLGHWFPIVGRAERTGWDEERASGIGDSSNFDVANFEVTLTVPKGVKVVTTGVRVQQGEREGKQRLRYYAGLSRDFAVECSARFESASGTAKGVRVASHFLPEHAAAGKRALGVAKQSLRFFSNKFGRCPYRELDVVEAPLVGGAGGMEFPGLVTIATMLYGQPASGDDDSNPFAAANQLLDDTLEFVVAHEVAHQWWNAAVGSNSKQHPFVDEALANYSALWYCESQHTPAEVERLRYLNIDLGYQMHRFMGGADSAVDRPAAEFPGIMAYSAIVYCKGALFYDALRKAMGDESFTLFLRNYYREHLYGQATPADVLEAARQATAAKGAVDSLGARWLEGTFGDEDIGRLQLTRFWQVVFADAMPDPQMAEAMGSLARVFDSLTGADGEGTSVLEGLGKALGGDALQELFGARGTQE